MEMVKNITMTLKEFQWCHRLPCAYKKQKGLNLQTKQILSCRQE